MHRWNIFQLMRHYTQWYNKLPSTSVIPINHIVLVCYWSHWMMQDFLINTKLYYMLQNQRLERWSLSLKVYNWLCKVFSNWNGSWSDYHRQNHLDQLSLHKYWVNKLAFTWLHCNNWDITEREEQNTIWPFWRPKQRFLVQVVNLKRRRRTFAWHLTPSKYSQKERKMAIAWQNNWWW